MASASSVVVTIGGKLASSLESTVGKARKRIGELGAELERAQKANLEKQDGYRTQLRDMAALGSTLFELIKPAAEFEAAMAGVRKTVDFDTPQQFKAMGADIVALSRRVPVAATDLAKVAAAAGQSGIARDEILDLTEAAAKMGVAFGIGAGEAGKSMAKWRSSMKLSQDQAEGLADAVGHLSTIPAGGVAGKPTSSAAGIVDVLDRSGGTAAKAGLSAEQTAAVGSAMLSAGATSETAATGIEALVGTLTAGENATESQRKAFGALGLDAIQLAKLMRTDAQEGILSVMAALEKLPEAQRNAAASDLFGAEGAGAITPLAAELDTLRLSFDAVSDSSMFAGSVQKDFASRSQASENGARLFLNQLDAIAINLSSIFLPALNDTFGAIGSLVGGVADLAERFPGATRVIGGAVIGLMGLRTVTFGMGTAWTFLKDSAIAGADMVTRSAGVMQTAAARAFSPFRTAGGLVMGAARQATVGYAFIRAGALTTGEVVSGAMQGMGRSLLGLLNPMGLVRGALFALRLAVIGTGIGALVVGIAAAGTWIYNNWDNLSAMFQGFGSAFMAALGPARPLVENLGSAISTLWGWISGILGPVEGAEGSFRSFGETVGSVIGGAVAWVAGLWEKIFELAGTVGDVVGWIASIDLFGSDEEAPPVPGPAPGKGTAKRTGAAAAPLAGALGAAVIAAPAMAAGPLPPAAPMTAEAPGFSSPAPQVAVPELGLVAVPAPSVPAAPPAPPALPPAESLAMAGPAWSSAGAGPSISINAPISVTVPPGSDANGIARVVREELDRLVAEAEARQRSALND